MELEFPSGLRGLVGGCCGGSLSSTEECLRWWDEDDQPGMPGPDRGEIESSDPAERALLGTVGEASEAGAPADGKGYEDEEGPAVVMMGKGPN